jgi:hypothetical protein
MKIASIYGVRLTGVFVVIGFFSLCIPPIAAESTYCAFEVKVASPSGTPVAGVTVALIRGHKTTFSETRTDVNGIARLCDAPLETMDIVVGFDLCGSVQVRYLTPRWPGTERVFVTYVKHTCGFASFRTDCFVLLRIEDEAGRPVSGARFEGKPSNGPEADVSDVFGRLFRSLKRGEKLEGVVIKEGRKSAHVSQECSDDTELKVVLKK